MAVLGPTAFGVVLWGSLACVLVVSVFVAYVVGRDAGLQA